MATLVSDPVRYVADQWENHCGYSSAVLSGIVPDSRHLDDGGYHCSVEDLRRFGNAGDYSNTRPDDKNLNVRYGAGIDMSMSPADMKRCHDRMRKVWADISDPRRKYLNCVNTWDGSGDAVRLDFYAGTAKFASADHKWHNHAEERRRYLQDMTAARAIVSALKGEAKTAYQASIGQGEDEDLKTDEREWLKALHAAFCDPGEGFAIAPAKEKRPLAELLGHAAYPLINDPGEKGSGAYVAAWMRRVTVEVAALRTVAETLGQTIIAGGGSVDTAAILAGVDRTVNNAVAAITAENRDAVADLGEGGAAQVRANT